MDVTGTKDMIHFKMIFLLLWITYIKLGQGKLHFPSTIGRCSVKNARRIVYNAM